jgi:hypothetical protein
MFSSKACVSFAAISSIALMAGLARADVISNAVGNKALDAHAPTVRSNGCKVQLWEFKREENQQRWTVVPVGGGWFKIVNNESKLVLDAHAPDVRKNGCKVQLWADKNELQQHWRIVDIGSGYRKIINRASGKVLDADAPNARRNGCTVQLWDDRNEPQQRWKIGKIID